MGGSFAWIVLAWCSIRNRDWVARHAQNLQIKRGRVLGPDRTGSSPVDVVLGVAVTGPAARLALVGSPAATFGAIGESVADVGGDTTEILTETISPVPNVVPHEPVFAIARGAAMAAAVVAPTTSATAQSQVQGLELATPSVEGRQFQSSLRLRMPSSTARASNADFVGAGRPTAAYFARARCRWVRTVVGAM